MKLADLFRKKPAPVLSYDREHLKPAMRCSICTGEQVAGFRDRQTGRFEEIMLIRSDADLQAFRDKYGITEEVVRFY